MRGICPSLCSTVLQELMASLQILRASVKIFGCTGWRACRAAVCCHWRRISALAVFRAWNWSAIQAHTFSINHVDAGTYLHLPKCQYFFLFSGNCFFRIGALVEKKDTFDFLRGLFVRSSKGPTFASLLFLPTNYTRKRR